MRDLIDNPYVNIFFFFLVHPWLLPAIIGVIIVAIVLIYKQKKKKKFKDISLAIPESRRTDLRFGYYSSLSHTFAQVKDHVNMFWSGFYDLDTWIKILKPADKFYVMDLPADLTSRENGKMVAHPDRESLLRMTFQVMRDAGVLHKIAYLYPVDEPQLNMRDADEFLKLIQTVKKLRSEFDELKNAKIMTIYLRGQGFWHSAELDVVGVDNYEQKSESLTKGSHADLVRNLLAGQKTVLVPGPAFGHNPEPWVAYALTHPDEVEMIAAFTWFDHPAHKDVPYTGLEAAPAEFVNKWRRAGHICMGEKGD